MTKSARRFGIAAFGLGMAALSLPLAASEPHEPLAPIDIERTIRARFVPLVAPPCDKQGPDKVIEVGVQNGAIWLSDFACSVQDARSVTWFSAGGQQFRVLFKNNKSPAKPKGPTRPWDFPSVTAGAQQQVKIRVQKSAQGREAFSYLVLIGDRLLDPVIIIDPN